METQIPSGTTAPSCPLTEPPTDAPLNEIAADASPAEATPAASKPTACKHCGLEGAHVEPSEPVMCGTCGKAHGSTTIALNRQTGQMVDRRVIVTHSLDGVVRDGAGQWGTNPICTLCVADLKCATFEARKVAKKGEKPIWPMFWALHLATGEATRRNEVDAQRRERQEANRELERRFDAEIDRRGRGFRIAVLRRFGENRAAGLEAALNAELAALGTLDALVAKYGDWVRGVVFAEVSRARCALDAAIAAMTGAIEAEAARLKRIDALVARGYNRTPTSSGERSGRSERRDAAPREPRPGERGGPRREKGDRRRRDGTPERLGTHHMPDDAE